MIVNSTSIAIAGTGRVAQALGRLLSEAGQPVMAIGGRNRNRTVQAARFISARTTPVAIHELPGRASHVLIAVSDTAVESVSEILARCDFVRGVTLHTCGAKGPEALAALARRGVSCGVLHPIQTFADPEQAVTQMAGSTFVIDGDTLAVEWGRSIAKLAGARSVNIRLKDRSLYHAAAVMASSHLAALIFGAVEMLKFAGLEASEALSALAPLITTCINNALDRGPVAALTGPIERGDAATILAHRRSLQSLPDHIQRLYCSAGQSVVQMALLRGLADLKAAQIQKLLRKA